MTHKFQVLQSSWGVVIFVEISDIINPILLSSDFVINEYLSIRINTSANIQNEKIILWFSKAIKDVEAELYEILCDSKVCFSINSIDFILTDFQEEGLYSVMLGWLEKRYSISIPKVEIDFDLQKGQTDVLAFSSDKIAMALSASLSKIISRTLKWWLTGIG